MIQKWGGVVPLGLGASQKWMASEYTWRVFCAGGSMKARDLGAGWNFCQAIWSGVAGFAETCGVALDSTFRETHPTVVAKVWRTFQRLIPQLGPVISWKKRDTFNTTRMLKSRWRSGTKALFRCTQNCIPENFWGKLKDEQAQIREIYPIYEEARPWICGI